jgi:uncharacterized membrane protein
LNLNIVKKEWFPASTSISSCHDQTKKSQSQLWNLKVLINFFFFIIFIIIIINSIIGIIVTIVVVLLLFIIYTINLPVVRPRSCWVIYYFDTSSLGRRHQSFGRVIRHAR